jgi:hypothetical protein
MVAPQDVSTKDSDHRLNLGLTFDFFSPALTWERSSVSNFVPKDHALIASNSDELAVAYEIRLFYRSVSISTTLLVEVAIPLKRRTGPT